MCVYFLPHGVKSVFNVVGDDPITISVWKAFDLLQEIDTDIMIQFELSELEDYPTVTYIKIINNVILVNPLILFEIVVEAGKIT